MFCKKISITAIFLISLSIFSQERVTKKIENTVFMTTSNSLNLEHKYGDVIVNGWNKDSLSILVEVEVNDKNEDQASELLNRIEFELKTIGDVINVSTKISDKNSSVFTKYFNKANPIDSHKGNVKINYVIYLPKNAAIEISNKFGDVVLNDWQGILNVNLEHGDLWIEKGIDKASLMMKFGKLKAKTINYANIELKNASVTIDFAENLKMNSSGSNIDINSVKTLELDSSKDETQIKKVDNLRGKIAFSEIVLDTVSEAIDLELKVTDFKVSKITLPEAYIYIKQSASDIDIGINEFAFKFNAYLEQGVIRIPKSFENIKTTMIDKGKRLREINATYGKNPSGKISITGEKGTIILRENAEN